MTVAILQPEAGDDRNKEVEIAKLYEMVYGGEGTLYESDSDNLEAGPGDIEFQSGFILRNLGKKAVGLSMTSPMLHAPTMRRVHVRLSSFD